MIALKNNKAVTVFHGITNKLSAYLGSDKIYPVDSPGVPYLIVSGGSGTTTGRSIYAISWGKWIGATNINNIPIVWGIGSNAIITGTKNDSTKDGNCTLISNISFPTNRCKKLKIHVASGNNNMGTNTVYLINASTNAMITYINIRNNADGEFDISGLSSFKIGIGLDRWAYNGDPYISFGSISVE